MVGEHIICQIELYVMVLVRLLFKDQLQNRRTIWWVDNDAARFCIIKGLSPSLTMKVLIREYYAVNSMPKHRHIAGWNESRARQMWPLGHPGVTVVKP